MDREKVKQAAQEFAYMFVVAFILTFAGFATGWTVLPSLGMLSAAFKASLASAIVATAKSLSWYFTGTKV